MSSSSYSCLPAGFKFQCYVPLDPSLPSSSSSNQNSSSAQEENVPRLVREALFNFPSFQHHVLNSEKQPVRNIDEAKSVLAQGRAENRANSDLESMISDQRVKADAAVEKVLTKKK